MPDIMQHSFGKPGSGGPIMAFERLLENSDFSYGRLLQAEPAGGVNINLIRRFILEIRKYRPELIHVRGLGNEGFHAVLAARLAGVPNILVSVHGTHRDLKTARQSRFRQWIVVNVLERLTLVLATHIATVCEYAFARSFLASYRSKLVGTVPNGVEIPKKVATKSYTLRLQLGIPVSYSVGVCVSRITMEKGYLVLAEALKRLDAKTKKFAILVIGGGDEGGRIKSHFSGLNSIKVVFLGHQKEVEKYLAISDFFVFPSLHENLSNALKQDFRTLPIVMREQPLMPIRDVLTKACLLSLALVMVLGKTAV
jgi:glycosyltransferase involved in cell wall biosynthesis